MAAHEEVRIVKNGSVVMYLAPVDEIQHHDSNDHTIKGLPNDRPPFLYNMNRVVGEITIQGSFLHSSELPDETSTSHQSELLDLFGNPSEVTAEDQMNRLRAKTLWSSDTSLLDIYCKDTKYIAATDSELDPLNGIFPQASIKELRHTDKSGNNRISFMIKFNIGFSD